MNRFVKLSRERLGWDHARFWLPAVAFLGAGQARADTIEWGNINGGDFSVGANWIGGVAPGAGDIARFARTRDPNQQLAYTVTFSSSPSTLGVVVASDRVMFDLNGNAYFLAHELSAMTIGTTANGSGRLTVTDGIMVTAPNALVAIGSVAPGFLTISTGGQLLGPAVLVGDEATGTLLVQNGGDIVGGPMVVGWFSTGTATITGAGSNAVIEDLTVGDEGPGTVNISAGGRVESTGGTIGDAVAGTVNVDGADSRWTSSGDVIVGNLSQGTLNITRGGEVRCIDGAIARSGGQSSVSVLGTDPVSGAASEWTITGTLSVGGDATDGIDGGSGSLIIGQGGTVTAGSVFIFPDSLVALRGGTLDASTIARTADPTAQLEFFSGTLHAGEVRFSLVNSGGTLAPGHSAGRTFIGVNYVQLPSATMEIELGGTVPITQFDQIVVAGTAFLDGRLDLRLIDGFVPSPAETFVILQAGDITGAFANVANGQRLAISDGRGSFVVHYGPGSQFDPTQVVLSDFGDCAADCDANGTLNVFDFLCFQTRFGNGDIAADCDGSGILNVFDFLCFQTAFGNGC